MSLRDKVRRIERATETSMSIVPQKGGGAARFPERALLDALACSYDRGRAHMIGEPLPAPHPLLYALYNAPEGAVEELASAHGWGISFLAGEEGIFRGDVRRPGPAVEWDDEGTVCR